MAQPVSAAGSTGVAQGASDWLNRSAVGKVEKRVLALYYPWYRTPVASGKWGHYDGVEPANRRMASHTHYPLRGPYDSTDAAAIERHLNQAKEAGIDTLVCSWWGRQDPTGRAIRMLLERAPSHGMSVCIYWERLSPRPDKLAASADLSYLLQTFGGKPAYLHLGDRPVLMLHSGVCQSLSASDWEEIFTLSLKRFPGGFAPIGTGDRLSDALLWDGLHGLDVATPMPERNAALSANTLHARFQTANALARRLGHIAIETVLPGYDDRKHNAISVTPGRKLVEREGGALYRALWRQAMADNPDWILILSFNQWHNGTEIEPSVELGEAYLALTRELLAQFKRQILK